LHLVQQTPHKEYVSSRICGYYLFICGLFKLRLYSDR
jgi:hypothetical protein